MAKERENHLDFSGVEAFWKVGSILSEDKEPEKELWDYLFETPGYAVLTVSEFTPDFFMEKWRVAFKPDYKKEREKALNRGDRFVEHFVKVWDNKTELEAYQQERRKRAFGKGQTNGRRVFAREV